MAFSDAFDLFAFLGKLSKRDMSAYSKLSPEGQKACAPFVLMRWMTGNTDAAQIVRINTFVNPYAFSLGGDKELLCKLLAAAATGTTGRNTWIKGPGSKSEKLRLEVIKQFYDISSREAVDYQIDNQSVLEMAEQLGWDDEQCKKLKKEMA